MTRRVSTKPAGWSITDFHDLLCLLSHSHKDFQDPTLRAIFCF